MERIEIKKGPEQKERRSGGKSRLSGKKSLLEGAKSGFWSLQREKEVRRQEKVENKRKNPTLGHLL